MMFCPKCGSIMLPKKEGKKTVMACSCGYSDKKGSDMSVKEIIKEKEQVEAIEENYEIYPLVEGIDCPKCGHNKSYFWEIQTRASDEPATKFHKCEKCLHVWRDYS